ncbi:MAG: hypothetical protein WEB04_01105 [Dehalococcoidia bacterium]
MLIALTISIAAGLAMLALIAGGALLARRAAGGQGAGAAFGSWRFYPSPWVLFLLPLVAAFFLSRFLPGFIFLPLFIVPFFLRRGVLGGIFSSRRRPKDDGPGETNGSDRDRFRDS